MFFAPGLVMLDAEAPPANDTEPPKPREIPQYKWIHCANEGEYKGHHQGGFDFTREVLEAFVRNFRASPQFKSGALELGGQQVTCGTEPVIQFDYEHASEMPPWEGTIPATGAPAPAWVVDVTVRNGPDGKGQLWALADLGPTIRQQIASRQYRWVSIAFTLEGVHWITGKPIGPVLTSIAFTNHPFMIDLEPLAAANRVTSQPARAAVRSGGDSSEAPDRSRNDSSRAGAKMEDKFREQLCRVLKINTLATDDQVVAAVDDSASSGNKLKSLVAALDQVDFESAMKVVPQLKEARDNAAALLDELNGLLGQAQAADAAVAPVDVGAAMRASGYKGDGAQKALAAHRQSLIDGEIAKVEKTKKAGERLSAAEFAAARDAGRKAFLTLHGITDQNNAALAVSLVAGPNGVQLSPPVAGRPLSMTDTQGTPSDAIDLRAVAGANVVDKMINHLRKSDPGFGALPWVRQVERAGILVQTAQVIQ